MALPATRPPVTDPKLQRRKNLALPAGNPIIGSERCASPNLKAFGSRSRSASDASVATAGPYNHQPAARPTPCRLAALCPWRRARIPKPGRVRWPEPPGLAAGPRTREEAPEECGAWSGLPQGVAPSHAPVDRAFRFLPLDCAAPSGWTIAPATSGLSEPVGTMVTCASWHMCRVTPTAGDLTQWHQVGRVALPATCALLHVHSGDTDRRRRGAALLARQRGTAGRDLVHRGRFPPPGKSLPRPAHRRSPPGGQRGVRARRTGRQPASSSAIQRSSALSGVTDDLFKIAR
jgi:hypothetical protein